MLRKILARLHLILGLASGLVVFVVAITGCIYVFSYELKPVFYQDRMFVSVPENPERRAISEMLETASAAVGHVTNCQRILIPSDENETVSFVFERTNKQALLYSDYMEVFKTVYVNPYNGQVVKIENTKWEFFNIVFWLHISLLLGYHRLGVDIIIWSVVIFIFLLISGLVLRWPKPKKIKKSFWFRWNNKTRWRRKNYDLHQLSGLYVCLIGLLFAFTGLFWASENFHEATTWLANGGKIVQEPIIPPSDTTQARDDSAIDQAYALVAQLSPTASAIMFRMPQFPEANYIVRAYFDKTNYDRIVYYFDQYSADLVFTETFPEKSNGDKIAALNYDLHTGSIAGLPTQILMFGSSLLIALLPVTGFMIWIGRKNKKSKKRRKHKASGNFQSV